METLLMKTQQMMTSLEIAELTGKQHKHVMEAIRKMEPAWEKVHGSKFRLMCRTQKGPVPFVHYSCVSTMVPLVQSTTGVCAKMRPRELVTDA